MEWGQSFVQHQEVPFPFMLFGSKIGERDCCPFGASKGGGCAVLMLSFERLKSRAFCLGSTPVQRWHDARTEVYVDSELESDLFPQSHHLRYGLEYLYSVD